MTQTFGIELPELAVKFNDPDGSIMDRIENLAGHLSGYGQSNEYYRRNRRANPERMFFDQIMAKKTEFMARDALVQHYGFPMIDVDTEVRDGANKGWQVDLEFSAVDPAFPDVHVKSCSEFSRMYANDYSFMFQFKNSRGGGGRDAIFDCTGNDLVCGVYMENHLSTSGIIKVIMPWQLAKPRLSLPKKLDLQDIKRSLYFRDLKS